MKNMINWIIGTDIKDKSDRMRHYLLMAWTVLGVIPSIITMVVIG